MNKKRTIFVSIVLAMGLLILQGCNSSDSTKNGNQPETVKASTSVDSLSDFNGTQGWGNANIYTDPKTGVEYWVLTDLSHQGGAGTGITPRLKANGKPYVNPKWRKR